MDEFKLELLQVLNGIAKSLEEISAALELKNLIAPVKKEIQSEHISGVSFKETAHKVGDQFIKELIESEQKEHTTEEVFMDLTEVTIEAFTPLAVLVTKKGYQKWVPRSVIDPQVDLSQLEKGQYYGIIPLSAKGEHWFHDKKTWEVYKVL